MKLVEKKCPSCGAGLKFGENDTNVTCEYCNKTYYLQKDEKKSMKVDESHLADAYKFVNEFGRPLVAKSQSFVFAIGIVMFVAVTMIGIISFNMINNNDNNKNLFDRFHEENKTKYVTKISQIDDITLETFNDTSLERIQSLDGSCTMGDYEVTKKWTYIGVYLLVSKEDDGNILYDVYEQTYKNKKTGVETTLYSAVEYEDLTLSEDGIVQDDYFAWPEVPSYEFEGTSFNGAYGYESIEKLYNKLVRSQRADYNIEASKGLYIED